jgi:hypothetical protein
MVSSMVYYFISAQDWTRTSTPLRAPAPQAGVSTNFTTWAFFSEGVSSKALQI